MHLVKTGEQACATPADGVFCVGTFDHDSVDVLFGLSKICEEMNPLEENYEHKEKRPYTASPQFDAALAMQLRPGYGVGADAAWLLRFIMTVFGWCAVLISGGRG